MATAYTSKYTYRRGRRPPRGVASGLSRRELLRMASPDGKPAVDGPAEPCAENLSDRQGPAKAENHHAG